MQFTITGKPSRKTCQARKLFEDIIKMDVRNWGRRIRKEFIEVRRDLVTQPL
jgi:hypothetical protein